MPLIDPSRTKSDHPPMSEPLPRWVTTALLVVMLITGLLATPILLILAFLAGAGGDVGPSEAQPGAMVAMLLINAGWVLAPIVALARRSKRRHDGNY